MALQLSLFDPEPAGSGPPPSASSGRVLIARGALAAEALLLERIGALLAEAREDPALLARPVRVVVPSRSLRLHVAAALVRARGRSAAGVRIQTLNGLALEVLERAGKAAPRGTPLFDVLAQRLARIEPALRHGLEELVDGYAAVAGTVRDLLDAGMELAHAEAAEEILAGDGHRSASRAEVERARALVRVAARTERLLAQAGLGRVSTLLRRAAELLESGGEDLLPARAVLVHGFADATGVATDLIQTLLRRRSAWVVLDRPSEAAGTLGLDAAGGVERAFTQRFAERLAVVALLEQGEQMEPDGRPPGPPKLQVTAFEAAGAEAESREVALRVRALLDGGARPEGIGVVARDLGRSPLARLALRRHFQRLGVPCSGVGGRGSLEPAGRRARAFLELLQRGEETPSDRWLDAAAALGPQRRDGLFVDLRLAFSTLGAGRLRDAAALPVDEILGENDSFPLPIRQGLKSAGRDKEQEDEEVEPEGRRRDREGEAFAARRRIAGAQLRGAVRAATRVRERLAAWPEEATAAEHLRRLRSLLAVDLGWSGKTEEARPVFAALEALEAQVPGDFLLTRHEARLLLAHELESAGTGTVGGAGGGVQVLAVMEARSRTFEHLFVLGMNRDVFPRPVREDPLLPDGLRRVLQRVLPDVPIKRSGFDEDRYLFAQLLSASPAVTLSWQTVDDDGRPLPASPLVERLRDGLTVEKAPPLYAVETLAPERRRAPRPAHEHAVLAALHGTRRDFGAVLPAALREARSADGRIDPAQLAAARLAVLEELDPDRRTPEGRAAAAHLGPYFGFVGAMAPRELYITYLEGLAACPWQLFLGRLLRIEPTPDPLEALPGADPLLLGNLVHSVLDRIADPTDTPAATVSSLLAREPTPVPWPTDEELDRLLREEARRLLAEEGIFLSGLARALAERARPLLEAARDADWESPEGHVPVLGTEVEGGLTVNDAAGRPRFLRFKADRLDRRGAQLVWTDYKTGRPFSASKKEETRRRHFLQRVRTGANLQGIAYLLAAVGAGRSGVGRYLFLRPDLESREFLIEPQDQPFLQAFQGAVETVLAAWDAGSFFPRVADPAGRDEPPRCQFCTVAEACVRGDSGARLRIVEWAREAGSAPRLAPAEAALVRLWRLAAPAQEPALVPAEEEG